MNIASAMGGALSAGKCQRGCAVWHCLCVASHPDAPLCFCAGCVVLCTWVTFHGMHTLLLLVPMVGCSCMVDVVVLQSVLLFTCMSCALHSLHSLAKVVSAPSGLQVSGLGFVALGVLP